MISLIFSLINQSGRLCVPCKPPENSLMTFWSNYDVGILWRENTYIKLQLNTSTHFETKKMTCFYQWEREKIPHFCVRYWLRKMNTSNRSITFFTSNPFFTTYLWILPLLWDNKKEFHQIKPWMKKGMINDRAITRT